MPKPSTLPRIAVRVTPELDTRVAAYAAEQLWTYAHTVEQLIMFAHRTDLDGPMLLSEGRAMRERVKRHQAAVRPVSRVVRVHPLVKRMVELGADGLELGGGRPVSRSAWIAATLEMGLDRAAA